MRKQFIIFLLFFTVSGLICSSPARAHRVNVFAWVEGDTIYTTAKFSGGRMAKESLVEVYDSREKLLLQGKSDAAGAFSFPVPKIDDLLIVIKAGIGHQGSWHIKKEELGLIKETNSSANRIQSAQVSSQAPTVSNNSKTNLADNSEAELTVSAKELELIIAKVINRSLDEKLHPLTVMIAESRNPDPGFKDIFGGLGYILGLVGVAAYFQSRKKSSPQNQKQRS